MAPSGHYGSFADVVGRRTRESVRMALGAATTNVIRLASVQNTRLAFMGLVVGLLAALLAVRPPGSSLYGVAPADVPGLLGVAALVLAFALRAAGDRRVAPPASTRSSPPAQSEYLPASPFPFSIPPP